MSIYITGDTHGDIGRFSDICSENDLREHDKLLICGDFGFIWYNSRDHTGKTADNSQLDELSKKPYEILFIDGNHENINELYSYPEIEKYGAPPIRFVIISTISNVVEYTTLEAIPFSHLAVHTVLIKLTENRIYPGGRRKCLMTMNIDALLSH